MYPFSSLPENLAAFCAVLRRDHRFRVGPGELHDAARALDIVDLSDERAVRHALRPILSGTLADASAFDEAFRGFFFPAAAAVPQAPLRSTRRDPGSAPAPAQRSQVMFLRNEISFSTPRAASSSVISRS